MTLDKIRENFNEGIKPCSSSTHNEVIKLMNQKEKRPRNQIRPEDNSAAPAGTKSHNSPVRRVTLDHSRPLSSITNKSNTPSISWRGEEPGCQYRTSASCGKDLSPHDDAAGLRRRPTEWPTRSLPMPATAEHGQDDSTGSCASKMENGGTAVSAGSHRSANAMCQDGPTSLNKGEVRIACYSHSNEVRTLSYGCSQEPSQKQRAWCRTSIKLEDTPTSVSTPCGTDQDKAPSKIQAPPSLQTRTGATCDKIEVAGETQRRPASQARPVVSPPLTEEDGIPPNYSRRSARLVPLNGHSARNGKEHDERNLLASLSLLDGRHLRVVSHTTAMIPNRSKSNFAEIVYAMVSECDSSNPGIMRWVCDGEAFKVDSNHPDLGDVLRRYFHHSKYSSFQRQLNTYGWNKCRGGRYAGVFYNPFFHRDVHNEADFSRIRRRPPPSERASSNPHRRPHRPGKREAKKRKADPGSVKISVYGGINAKSTRPQCKIQCVSLKSRAPSTARKAGTSGSGTAKTSTTKILPTDTEGKDRDVVAWHAQGSAVGVNGSQGPKRQTTKKTVSVRTNWGKKQLLAVKKQYNPTGRSAHSTCGETSAEEVRNHRCPTPSKQVRVSTPLFRAGDVPDCIGEPAMRTPQLGLEQVLFSPSQMVGTGDDGLSFNEADFFSSSPLIPFNGNLMMDSPHASFSLADSVFLPIEPQQSVLGTCGNEKPGRGASKTCTATSDATQVESSDKAEQPRAIRVRFHRGKAGFSPMNPCPQIPPEYKTIGNCKADPHCLTMSQSDTPRSRNPRSVCTTPRGSPEDITVSTWSVTTTACKASEAEAARCAGHICNPDTKSLDRASKSREPSIFIKSEFGWATDLSHTLDMQGTGDK